MSFSVTVEVKTQGFGQEHIRRSTITGDMGIEPVSVTLPAATTVATWTKSDANTATATLAAEHGLASGTYDVYWAAGVRYGVAVTITVNSVALEGGAGDDFPDSDTAVNISEQLTIPSEFDGDELAAISATCTTRANVVFQTTGPTAYMAVELSDANDYSFEWDNESNADNPLSEGTATPIVSIVASNGDTTAGTLEMFGVQNAIE
jgi:hypothetical protein